jgi:Metallo-peptidase family M12/Disintegrin
MNSGKGSLRSGLAAILLLMTICFVQSVYGSSRRPLPLKQLTHISNIRLERATGLFNEKRSLNSSASSSLGSISHSDQFRLSFEAFDNIFHLHLQPTEHLVPSTGATVRYTSYDPETGQDVVSKTETIFPHDIRAYHGVVMHKYYTAKRLAEDRIGLRRDLGTNTFSETDEGVMGTASIILHDDGTESGKPSFEGTFDWAGNEHIIQLPLNYQSSRSSHDPNLRKRAVEDGSLVLHRRSDRMSWPEAHLLNIRTEEEDDQVGCNADGYDFNANHALRLPSSNEDDLPNTLSPFSFFALPYQPKIGRRSVFPNLLNGELFRKHSRRHNLATSTNGYSYHEAFVKRQGGADVLGGSNNDSYIDDIGSKTGCPNANRVVYMGIATDCTYTARFSNSSATRIQVLNDMNTVSNIYRSTFRVSLGVVQLDIRDANNCPSSGQGNARWNQQCSDSYTLDQRLSDFSSWRANQNANGTGLWHLLTTCLSGSEVGVAWLGTLCKTDSSGSGSSVVSGTGVTASTENEAQTMAHEIGHNFGAVHDCIQNCAINGNTARQNAGSGPICCPRSSSSCNSNAAYIMSPYSAQATSDFSPCSIGNICSMLGQGLDTSCVVDPSQSGRETLSVQQCGNGILEPGEECDAGPNGSNCCTTQCRLTSGSVCDPEGTACCTNQCQFANATTVCRPAVDDRCDTAETCTGSSSECPTDIRKNNGASCGSGLQCAAGHCTSRDQQCREQSSSGDFNFTEACSVTADNSCSVSCVDPSRPNTCAVLQQNFIDGTECGYGGFCEGGQCKSGSWQDTFNSWYRNNLRISIPVTIVVGIIILLVLYGLLRCLCLPLFGRATGRKVTGATGPVARQNGNRRSRGQQSSYNNQPPPQHPYGSGGNGYYQNNVPAPPPPTRQTGGWVDPYSMNGPIGPDYPSRRG